MTLKQFSQAMKMVESGADLSAFDDEILHGCGLPDFKPVVVPLEVAAKLIGYQARKFNGQWDLEELNYMRKISKKNFLIV